MFFLDKRFAYVPTDQEVQKVVEAAQSPNKQNDDPNVVDAWKCDGVHHSFVTVQTLDGLREMCNMCGHME